MKKMGNTKFITIVLVVMVLGLGYYTYLNNSKKNGNRELASQSEAEKLINYDFANNYPKTVREAVKLHCRYLKEVYNGGFEEQDLYTVNNQIRQLFDDELLELNSSEGQLQSLKNEMALFKENKQKFVSYSLAEPSQIEYNTEDNIEYAKIGVTLVLKVGASSMSADEEYILRKDKEGKWKILGWQAVKNDEGEKK